MNNKIKYGTQALLRIHPNLNDCPKTLDGLCCEQCKIAFDTISEGMEQFTTFQKVLHRTITAIIIIAHPIRFVKGFIKFVKFQNAKHIPEEGSK